jgi:hypothetical protein
MLEKSRVKLYWGLSIDSHNYEVRSNDSRKSVFALIRFCYDGVWGEYGDWFFHLCKESIDDHGKTIENGTESFTATIGNGVISIKDRYELGLFAVISIYDFQKFSGAFAQCITKHTDQDIQLTLLDE